MCRFILGFSQDLLTLDLSTHRTMTVLLQKDGNMRIITSQHRDLDLPLASRLVATA